ncbi:hypothetical protein ZOSMA_18G01080 [Zostera marina]|uniref:Ricin B lectin domain-containing protein n=1 Tax=Zostera marina TaxID=29655 RepID=A0A0K9PRZ4_ZOSMR|nr:hypothetical protein ZOSMA_18G01080 [Zostera marina]
MEEYLRKKKIVRIFTKADENYSLTIRDGEIVLAPADPDDEFQHWVKDEKYALKVKDRVDSSSFSLVNIATGEAIKHSTNADNNQEVSLTPYNLDRRGIDIFVLWSEGDDLGNGFRAIRKVNDISLNFDAFNGDKDHGGVRDGTKLTLWDWWSGDNQQWKIEKY